MKTCTTCSRQFPDEYEFCLTDGTNLFKNIEQVVPLSAVTQTWKFCGKCAEPVSAEYLFCKKCGTPRGDHKPAETFATKPVEIVEAPAFTEVTEQNKDKILIGAAAFVVVLIVGIIWLAASSSSSNVTTNNTNQNANQTNNAVLSNAKKYTNYGNNNYKPANSNYVRQTNSTTNKRTGRLTTDSNIRDESNKDSMSLGIHFKGATVEILDETSYSRDDGEYVTWYRVKVMEYGCSVDPNLGCGKNSDSDSDEGWINGKNILLD